MSNASPSFAPRPPPERPRARSGALAYSNDDVVRIGLQRGYFDDLYHYLLDAAWSRLLALIASIYFGLNAVFALLYLLGGDCIAGAEPGSFRDAYFFSLQTLATIGYGVMAPKGVYANAIVTVEAFIGLLGVAMASGLMFAKFARPTARVLFSRHLVVVPRNGVPCLMLRMANGRGNDVVEASVRISVLKQETTLEGESMRRVHDLVLVRNQSPLFVMTWTAMHPIDAASPLHGMDLDAMIAAELRFIVTFTGIDGTFAQTIHARQVYSIDDVRWGMRFVDVTVALPDGRMQVDYGRFHDVEPVTSVDSTFGGTAPRPEASGDDGATAA